MNRFVYTLTTIIFVIIAGVTAYMVIDKNGIQKTPAVETVQEASVEEPAVVEEPAQEPEVEEQVEEPEPEPEEVKCYTYTVRDARWLHIRAEEGMDNDPVGKLPRGYTGYVVKMTGHWTLVCADGYIGYCSDSYLDLVEIDVSAFPEELKAFDENDAGTKPLEGKIGEVEEANAKNVKWF
ncbi:hypothetical protein [Pseudobutyrivibrio sp. MD2005]|uniref:hypothetical protein n=1 Tax=Pseudobutyrivibrio sp. MD2005 TaxID=1410616 RepID=UPI000487AB20|nr:hypothetical protein [Pseudobutyrivibrio sp. MD2005]